MNEHERQRIADAMHHLRPDWPTKQLLTLLAHPQLADRPRRDVTVALGWVACEPGTASPYRVLEAGPWWRATGVDGTGSRPMNRGPWCGICGVSQELHRAEDHEFERVDNRKRAPDAMAAIVTELRGHLEPTKPPAEPREHVPDPDGPAARARAALTTTRPDVGDDTQEDA